MKGNPSLETSRFHSVDYLKTPGAIAAYLTEAFETNDTAYIRAALETVLSAKGISDIANASKLEFEAVRNVLNSLGVRLVVEPVEVKKST
jgi:probable addiction module antidote protein